MAFRRKSPEAELLYRLLMAVEHYGRMGWLEIPESERWKYEDLIADVREVMPVAI